MPRAAPRKESSMELSKRKDVPQELTWDLSAIYATEADMYADADRAMELGKAIEERYKGRLDTPERLPG